MLQIALNKNIKNLGWEMVKSVAFKLFKYDAKVQGWISPWVRLAVSWAWSEKFREFVNYLLLAPSGALYAHNYAPLDSNLETQTYFFTHSNAPVSQQLYS